MVITIEPGIYVPEGADTDPAYWNLGVRIEDTYILTDDGWEEITSYPWFPGSGENPPRTAPAAEGESQTEADSPGKSDPVAGIDAPTEVEAGAEVR